MIKMRGCPVAPPQPPPDSGRRRWGTAASILAILVAAVVIAVIVALVANRQAAVSGTPASLYVDLTAEQRRGLNLADAVARANAARFPHVRMSRCEHLVRAAMRLGWRVRLWDDAGAVVPLESDGGASTDVERDARAATVRRIMRDGGVVQLTPPWPRADGTTQSASPPPPIICRRDSISWTPRPAAVLAGDKHACSRWLAGNGIPVPANIVVRMDARDALTVASVAEKLRASLASRADALQLLAGSDGGAEPEPVVIKPVEGTCGRGITADVVGLDNATAVLARSRRQTGVTRWLVERQIRGPSHRVIVACPPLGAPPRILYACERLSPLVIGDGVHTVDELLAADARARTPWHPPAPTADAQWMRRYGVDPRRCVPDAGRAMRVRMPTNWAQGGSHWRVDPDACLHRDNAAMLCAAAACLPGRPFLVALDTVGDPAVAWWRRDAVGPAIHDVELNSGLEDIPGGCDWVPADESRLFDAILQAYVA